MRMRFSHRGRQFFFLTFALKGRPKVLSEIVAVEKPAKASGSAAATGGARGAASGSAAAVGGARGAAPSVVRSYDVALSPWGEAVVEEWKGQHAQNPALTASARVVMPDHCHFLLIVNYDADPRFDILDWLHHFRRAVEARWAAVADDGRGAAPCPQWEDAFWLDLSFDSRQLAAIRRYIRMNPARAAWKAAHPDRFALIPRLRHAALPVGAPWHGMGDPTLLASPFLFHVRLTARLTAEGHGPAIDEIVARARRGGIAVSGFISQGEIALFRRLADEPHARMVKTVPYALLPAYDPSVAESRLLAENRLFILSGFPASAVRGEKISRANCNRMNDLAAAFCENVARFAD